jgi:hypothetical protein
MDVVSLGAARVKFDISGRMSGSMLNRGQASIWTRILEGVTVECRRSSEAIQRYELLGERLADLHAAKPILGLEVVRNAGMVTMLSTSWRVARLILQHPKAASRSR